MKITVLANLIRKLSSVVMIFVAIPVLAQTADEEVHKILAKSAENESKLHPFECRFAVTVAEAVSEDEIKTGKFVNLLGQAKGRMVISGQMQLYEIEIGDVFRVEKPENDRVEQALFVPFLGSQTILKNEQYVVYLANTFSVGQVGRRQSFFPPEQFNPFHALGAIASEALAEPIRWYLEPPEPITHEIRQEGETISIVSKMPSAELLAEFDGASNFLLTKFRISQGNRQGLYYVSDVHKLENGACFPKVAVALFADEGDFPKRVARWDLVSVSNNVDEESFVVNLPNKNYQISLHGAPSSISHIAPDSIVVPTGLEKIYDACLEKLEFAELPQRKTANSVDK